MELTNKVKKFKTQLLVVKAQTDLMIDATKSYENSKGCPFLQDGLYDAHKLLVEEFEKLQDSLLLDVSRVPAEVTSKRIVNDLFSTLGSILKPRV